MPLEQLLDACGHIQLRLQNALVRKLDRESQRLDQMASRAGRPAALLGRLQLRLAGLGQRIAYALAQQFQAQQTRLLANQSALRNAANQSMHGQRSRLAHLGVHLGALDPQLVLGRGYAWLQDDAGSPVTGIADMQTGQRVQARLSDGTADMQVQAIRRAQA